MVPPNKALQPTVPLGGPGAAPRARPRGPRLNAKSLGGRASCRGGPPRSPQGPGTATSTERRAPTPRWCPRPTASGTSRVCLATLHAAARPTNTVTIGPERGAEAALPTDRRLSDDALGASVVHVAPYARNRPPALALDTDLFHGFDPCRMTREG
jgi:hypothetical protein